jgi:hypothetical protein
MMVATTSVVNVFNVNVGEWLLTSLGWTLPTFLYGSDTSALFHLWKEM